MQRTTLLLLLVGVLAEQAEIIPVRPDRVSTRVGNKLGSFVNTL